MKSWSLIDTAKRILQGIFDKLQRAHQIEDLHQGKKEDTKSNINYIEGSLGDNATDSIIGHHNRQTRNQIFIDKFFNNTLDRQYEPKAVDRNHPIVVTCKILDTDYISTVDQDGRKVLVPASGHIVRLTVEAIDSRTTIIQNIYPIIFSWSAPTGILSPHFGIVTPRPFEVLLDESPPKLRPIDPTGPNFPFKVSAGDPEVFDLTVLTYTGDVRWRLELNWTSLGQEGTLPIDLGGFPFRTMARPK